MGEDKRIYETYSNEDILQGFENLVARYMSSQSGNILDIGCGQSPFILSMIKGDYHFSAFDTEYDALYYLQERIRKIDEDLLDKIDFRNKRFELEDVKGEVYDAIVLSQIMHFWLLDDCINLILGLLDNTQKGTVFFFKAHSTKHSWYNKTKHTFFTEENLKSIFNTSWFEWVYYSDVVKQPDVQESERYAEKAITDEKFKDLTIGTITLVVRRR